MNRRYQLLIIQMGSSITQTGHSRIDDGSVEKSLEFNHKDMIKIHKRNIMQDYTLFEVKGKGASAQVYRGVLKNGKVERAIKVVRKRGQGLSPEYANQFNILKMLDHPNILKIFQIYEDANKFYIVTELCEGGQLLDRILEKKHFTQADACVYFLQIMQAVSYMHDNRFMHRDLKPQNLLFTEKSQKASLKLIDLGAACYFDSSQMIQRKKVGTSYYIAPEVLQKRYNQKCDIWSCGVILFILLSGQTPFAGKDDNEILKKVSSGNFSFSSKIWKCISEQARDLVCHMLQMNVKKRYSAKQVLKHPWMSKFGQEKVKNMVLEQCLSNMRNFGALKKLQQGIYIFIVNFLTSNQQREKHLKIFRHIDTNGDGMISKEQLRKALQKTDKQLVGNAAKFNQMFDKIDKDKSGFIDYSEFLMASMNLESTLSEQKLDAAFQMIDIDGNGKVSISELKSKLGSNISEEMYSMLLKQLDKSKTGDMTKAQFVKMMKRLTFKNY